jgi:N-methylhydantoinase A
MAGKRQFRVGIDVGGTYTKAVAIDNDTHEIVGKSQIKTTHSHPDGVANGVIRTFQSVLSENEIKPEEVTFVAHSTTQATNALLEGDVANVGIIGVARGGLEGLLAKKQCYLDDIGLGTGRSIKVCNSFIPKKKFSDEIVEQEVKSLKKIGSQVIVASMAFGVDDTECEETIKQVAEKMDMPTTVASDITKLYGLTRRTRTAAINASILPKMFNTAHCTERSVRDAGVNVPIMIMRGDGGVMDITEVKRRPVLTMLSGPAASVMGSLMYLRASNGIYFEVGGTSTNIGVIKNGRPAIDYSIVGGHKTYISSLDVRVLGVAGGSMLRGNKEGVIDVGPRSAHIAGLEYAVYTPEEEIVDPQIEFFSPRKGDPNDYIAIKLASGKRIAITNSCAANVLGLVKPEHFAYGNANSARKAMQSVADYMRITVEELAEHILTKAYEKIKPVIDELSLKYQLDIDAMNLVGVGGGAASLIIYSAEKMGLQYSIPVNAEVISSIGVALAMVRDVVERIIPNPSPNEIKSIRREAFEKAVESGASSETVEVHIEIDSKRQKVVAIATGSTEVRTTNLLKECSEEEAAQLAATDLHSMVSEIKLVFSTPHFYAYQKSFGDKNALRILDKRGFIRVQRSDAVVSHVTVEECAQEIQRLWKSESVYLSESLMRPDFYICIGTRMVDITGMTDVEKVLMLLEIELDDHDPDEIVLIATAKNV